MAISATETGSDTGDRRQAMSLLARATLAELQDAWADLDDQPVVWPVRGPETGLVMVRGRIGGGGGPFNLGEATVTRASIRLDDGLVGHGQMLGSDRERARLAAVFDALLQRPDRPDAATRLLSNVASRIAADDAAVERQTAATRVDFFTMVRGED